jgi:hypothetical protein
MCGQQICHGERESQLLDAGTERRNFTDTTPLPMHYYLRGPGGQVVGLRLSASEIGHEIYDILGWADQNLGSYSVEQTDGQVRVHSDDLGEMEEVHEEPFKPSGKGRDSGSEAPSRDDDSSDDDGSTARPSLR